MGEVMKLKLHNSFYFRRAEDDEELFDSESFSDDSNDDSVSSSTSDHTDDASSSPKLSCSPTDEEIETKGPLYQLSSLMDQLPVKRGLSKCYQGKSQSYTSLTNVRSIEDLAKKKNLIRRKLKPSRSYYAGIDTAQKQCYAPGPLGKIISKKSFQGKLMFFFSDKEE